MGDYEGSIQYDADKDFVESYKNLEEPLFRKAREAKE